MTTVRAGASGWAVGRAEFLKIQDSRFPLLMLAALPAATFLFVFELYHVERVLDHVSSADPLRLFALLFFSSWKALLFPAAIVAFAAYWTTVDSQYGMIRVAACQPITRTAYLLGKWIGITGHVTLLTMAYLLLLLMWTVIYAGVGGLQRDVWPVLGRFALEVVVFVIAVETIACAVASLRSTVGGGLITALLTMIVLAFAMLLPFDVVPPRLVFMRYFVFPLGELPNPFIGEGDSPFVRAHGVTDFYVAVVITPLVFAVVAAWRFGRRNIVE